MKRLEENGMLLDQMAMKTKRKPTGTYEEMVAFQLGMIATVLTDISRSLAVIADQAERNKV